MAEHLSLTVPVDLRSGIVRILRPDGTTAGTGFVVSADGLIATCSHVVLDVRAQQREEQLPETVRIVFPTILEEREARVEPDCWLPREQGDVAFLRLEGLPEGVEALPLGPAAGSAGHTFRTRGFRGESERAGVGQILDLVMVMPGRDALQLRSQEVTQGFSGAPVWDEQAERVVGMVSEITPPDQHSRGRDTAFATTGETIYGVCLASQLNWRGAAGDPLNNPPPQRNTLVGRDGIRRVRTLRLTQTSEGGDRYRVQMRLEGDDLAPIEATSLVSFSLTARDLEDLRWYLEEYAEFPYEPAPTNAARVERRVADIGIALFDAVFRSSDDARDLWAAIRADLSDTRVEVVADVGSPSVPWELLRDPTTNVPLALRARAFVRTLPTPAQRPRLPGSADGPVRILLVISRPAGGDDVPFRSVASRLIAALGTTSDRYQLDVLRPATFARLSQVLREAHLRGEPYHVVHFDGHGIYLSYRPQDGAAPLVFGTPRLGSHGYLAFEDPTASDGVEIADGPTLGSLLAETHVSVLVLNACRSAHAEPLTEPSSAPAAEDQADPHAQVRAFGSLAQEVMDAGVAGVVAMLFNVYVVTAAQFVADLYAALRRGRALGEAVSLG